MKTNEDVSPYVCMLRGNFMPPHHTNFCWISQLWGANYFRQFHPLWNNGTSFLCRGFGGHFLFWKNKQTNKNEIVIWFPYTSVKKVKQEPTRLQRRSLISGQGHGNTFQSFLWIQLIRFEYDFSKWEWQFVTRNEKENRAEMRPSSVSRNVTRDAAVSYWPIFSLSLVTSLRRLRFNWLDPVFLSLLKWQMVNDNSGMPSEETDVLTKFMNLVSETNKTTESLTH